MLRALRTLAMSEVRSRNSYAWRDHRRCRRARQNAPGALWRRALRAVFVVDHLLLHELDIERAPPAPVAIEQLLARFSRDDQAQGID